MELIEDLGIYSLNDNKYPRHYGVWQCPKCPNTITTTFTKIASRAHNMCKDCARIEAFAIRRVKQERVFINAVKEFHKNRYTYDKVNYINNKTKVIITCPIHGDFEQTPSAHYMHGCDKCRADGSRKSTEQFIEDALAVHGEKYNYSHVLYWTTVTQVKIQCRNCATYFEQRPNDHLNGSGCPICNRGSDLDSLYVWKIMGTDIYKFGVTSFRLGDIRLNQVVTSLRKNGYNVDGIEKIVQIKSTSAKEIENYLHSKYQTKPTSLPRDFDGKTEFRVLTKLEELELVHHIKDTYAISEIIQDHKDRKNTNM